MLRAFCSEWMGDSAIPMLSRDEMHHLVRVRRVRAGEHIEILNGRGAVMSCEVKSVAASSLDLAIENIQTVAPAAIRTHLLVAIPKGKTFPALLHKAVELGVARITPLLTDNTEMVAGRMNGKSDRWESVLIEAVKQSGNPWMPVLHPPSQLEQALDAGMDGDLRLCAALQPDAQPLRKILEAAAPSAGTIDVMVGPEGDFSPREYKLLRMSGCRFAGLGPLVLKVETAASLAIGFIELFCCDK